MKPLLAAFDVIPGALWALLLAGALAFGGVQYLRLGDARLATSEARTDLANYKATAAESARLAERAERAEEARRETLQRKALDEAHFNLEAAQTDAAGARTAGEQLRVQAQRFAAAAREASARAAAAERSAAGADPLGVFVHVLGRIDERAGRLAEIADRARVAGQLCERSYDALTQTAP